MSEYIPTPGPHEGQQYEPSNGTEGECFIEYWCSRCERDKEMNGTCYEEEREAGDDDWCPILNASYRGEAVEWRELADGRTQCIAFVAKGSKDLARCEHTTDMFAP
jgi:hypothetical protein